jgi:fumarate hydratase subunit alpha
MRELHVDRVTETVAALCQEANYTLTPDVIQAFERGKVEEESPVGREIFSMLLENVRIASREMVPICQDTGLAIVFLEVGQDLHLVGGDLNEAVQRGVAKGYTEGYLRNSVVAHPFQRKNTGNNTPAIIHTSIVPGDRLKVTVAPKGGGSENMSALRMMKPSDGQKGVRAFIVETVARAGPNPCPPVVVGVGLGGDFELSAILAKKALLRPLGQRHPDPFFATMEEELLEEINREGIGPMGLGGRITALDVHVEFHPCHIASLPVAVNINCHATRHRERLL